MKLSQQILKATKAIPLASENTPVKKVSVRSKTVPKESEVLQQPTSLADGFMDLIQ